MRYGGTVEPSDLEAATPDGRERYRTALLLVSGLAFCQLDAPAW